MLEDESACATGGAGDRMRDSVPLGDGARDVAEVGGLSDAENDSCAPADLGIGGTGLRARAMAGVVEAGLFERVCVGVRVPLSRSRWASTCEARS
jgi:hypothetical protein